MPATRRVICRDAPMAVLALLAVVLAGCGGGKGSAKVTASPTPAKPDAATILRQAADKMEQVKSFHFVLSHDKGNSPITLGPGVSLSMTRAEGDVQRPDRLRADVDATALGGVKINVKLVSIGDTTKISNPFNPSQWQSLPTGTKLSDVFDPAAGVTAALRSVKDPQLVGEEMVNGQKAWKIEGTVDAAALKALAPVAESGYTAKGTAWIGEDTREVYRVLLDGPLGSQDTPGVIRRIELSHFDENIAITPPPS